VTEEAAAAAGVDEELIRKLNMPISELELSVRASNCLESARIETVAQLVTQSTRTCSSSAPSAVRRCVK
jgi:DNA-directed RNA polymerase alpha subunit